MAPAHPEMSHFPDIQLLDIGYLSEEKALEIMLPHKVHPDIGGILHISHRTECRFVENEGSVAGMKMKQGIRHTAYYSAAGEQKMTASHWSHTYIIAYF